MSPRSFWCVLGVFIASILPGCESKVPVSPTESSNLKPLAVMYGRFISTNQGRGPQSLEELKAFIQSRSKDELSNLNISDIESLFVSSRDKKPYRFKFDSKPSAPGQSTNVFAWEQEGVAGKRYVAGTLGEILEVDQTKFAQLVPNP